MKFRNLFSFVALTTCLSAGSAYASCAAHDQSMFADGDVALKLGDGSNAQLGPRRMMANQWIEEGTVIYNRVSKQLQFCDGSDWIDIQSAGAPAESNTGDACPSSTVKWGDGQNCSDTKSSEPHGYIFLAKQNHIPGDCNNRTRWSWGGYQSYKCTNGEWIKNGGGSCTYEKRDFTGMNVDCISR